MNLSRAVADLIREAVAAGWTSVPTRTGRYMLRHPSGATVVVWTTTDPRGLKNARAAIRRVQEGRTTP